MALYCGAIVFSGRNIDKRLTRLWVLFSEIVDIVFDPRPRRSLIRNLREKVATAHAVHWDLFLVDDSFAFIVPTNTHAVLHLSEMLSQCSPLPNVTQSIPVRFVGEVFEMVTSSLKPDTQLFNKTNILFSLRMLHGGLYYTKDIAADSMNDKHLTKCDQPHIAVLESPSRSNDRKRAVETAELAAKQCFRPVENVAIQNVQLFKNVSLGEEGTNFAIEAEHVFVSRRDQFRNARQKFWIAVHLL